MELSIDPHATLAELQFTLFMAAISALVELAKTTDKDHIKLRALTEVARLCNPAKRPATDSTSPKPTLSPRRVGSTGFTPSSTPTSSSASPAPAPAQHGTPSAAPQAPATSHASSSPRATAIGSPRRPKPVSSSPADQLPLESLLPLNRRQRRFLARLETNERKRENKHRAAA